MNTLREINKLIKLTESKKFWKNVYNKDDTHWLDKKPSNLTKKIINKYGKFNRVLEVGCANGVDSILLASVTSDRVIGIDLIPEVIKIANKNLESQLGSVRDKVSFEIGNVEKLRYKDNSFDLVYSLSVLHSTNIKKSLKEIHRVLSDNGNCVVYVFIGKGKEPIDKDSFLTECKKFFEITEQKEISKVDKGLDKHDALIVYMKKGE